jgi:hypothetical protein
MVVVLMLELSRRGVFNSERFQTTSCHGALPRLRSDASPPFESFECKGNNLKVTYNSEVKININKQNIALLYKDLANKFTFLSEKVPSDFVAEIDIVSIKLIHSQVVINAVAEGKNLYSMKIARNKGELARVFKDKVQVQEIWKESK